ncbi:MAG: hypothetical protein ABEJ06_03515 [Haloarculaceae archaeon]
MKRLSRRRLLGATATAGASACALAGCLRDRHLEIVARDSDTTALGTFVLTAIVENPARSPREAELTAAVTLGGERYEKVRTIAVPSQDYETYDVRFDLPPGDDGPREYAVTLE